MSTELKTLKGLIEIPNPKTHVSEYKETDILLNSFWGGTKRGCSLQITFENESGNYSHVQLDNTQVLELIKELQEIYHK